MNVSAERLAYLRAVYMDEIGAELPEHERLALKREFIGLYDNPSRFDIEIAPCTGCGRNGYRGQAYGERCHGCARSFADCPCPPCEHRQEVAP